MSFPEFTDETRILPASKAFVLFWAERISVPFTTFGYRQITFLSTYPWETYLMLALLTFLRVCACVCSILCFSVHLFSVRSEISPATPPKGSPLQGATPICGTMSPQPTTLSRLWRRCHCSLIFCRTPSCPGAGTDEHFQSPASTCTPPSISLPPIIGLWPHTTA